MEHLPEFEDVNKLLKWSMKNNAVHLMKACLALINEKAE
jgi:hypothetical protein